MEGRMGAIPDDYALGQAARYWNVAPWELMEQSIWWTERALMFMDEEYEAKQSIDQHNRNK